MFDKSHFIFKNVFNNPLRGCLKGSFVNIECAFHPPYSPVFVSCCVKFDYRFPVIVF